MLMGIIAQPTMVMAMKMSRHVLSEAQEDNRIQADGTDEAMFLGTEDGFNPREDVSQWKSSWFEP